ncbi:transcriptional repressor [Aeromicrobium sp.]|uniref:Fur family transcriptional regulator n=1 Tax=Aeromicrobium sp. TaxID=1871063 RepID=UPI0028B05F2B|nr:transcriptional repressor [Aeromicrobium sp.]
MASRTAPVAFTEEGRRNSRPRRLVREYMDECEIFSSAQQVHDALRAQGDKVGLATVYRNLQGMAEAGEVDVLRHGDGEMLFRKCGDVHHHHLVCRSCGLTIEIAGPAVERWAAEAADDHGFADVTHSVELFGLCADCAATADSDSSR